MASLSDTLEELARLARERSWSTLHARAIAAADEHPASVDVAVYAAHALRQLGALDEGYAWATRARTIDPANLSAICHVSMLANLTKRYDEAFACGVSLIERETMDEGDRLNVAITIVNGIHGASHIKKIPEAVERFTPMIERLDHPNLHFNSACLYALAGDDARAFAYMAKALAHEKPKADFADADFDRLRADPQFTTLLARDWQAENAALERSHKPGRDHLVPEDFLGELSIGIVDERCHPELERAIDANVDDPHGYDVYSDWLQSQDDPRGMFILASKRCEAARDESERMFAYIDWAKQLTEHAGAWLGGFAPYVHASRWKWGFIRTLHYDTGSVGPLDDVGPLFADTLTLPVCRFVRELRVADIWCGEKLDYAEIVDVLREHWPVHLRDLNIGPEDVELSQAYVDISPLANDRLEELLVGGNHLRLGALAFPNLKELGILTGGLTRENLADICKADLPHLEHLDVWFGDQQFGADVFTGSDLAPLFARRYRSLGLKNANFTDEIMQVLVGWRGLTDLTRLDLSYGTLTDEGAQLLIDNVERFAHLERIDLEQNVISEEMRERLWKVLPKQLRVNLSDQKEDRYVTVG
jgi:uncharacterized protein (TIGR02996 family)